MRYGTLPCPYKLDLGDEFVECYGHERSGEICHGYSYSERQVKYWDRGEEVVKANYSFNIFRPSTWLFSTSDEYVDLRIDRDRQRQIFDTTVQDYILLLERLLPKMSDVKQLSPELKRKLKLMQDKGEIKQGDRIRAYPKSGEIKIIERNLPTSQIVLDIVREHDIEMHEWEDGLFVLTLDKQIMGSPMTEEAAKGAQHWLQKEGLKDILTYFAPEGAADVIKMQQQQLKSLREQVDAMRNERIEAL